MRSKRPVARYDGGNIVGVYGSVKEASESVGGQVSHISECCSNKPHRLTHKNNEWRYYDGFDNTMGTTKSKDGH